MRDLSLLVLSADPERFRGALTIAAAQAALGAKAAIFLQLGAVRLLAMAAPDDSLHQTTGLPTLKQLIDDALELGVSVTACQSGLALCDVPADTLDPRVEVGGPIAFLKEADQGRLLLV